MDSSICPDIIAVHSPNFFFIFIFSFTRALLNLVSMPPYLASYLKL